MVTAIKKGATKAEIDKALKKLENSPNRKRFDAKKFCGTVKFDEDGLTLQKRWRDEWQ